jgi:hypothetical protein
METAVCRVWQESTRFPQDHLRALIVNKGHIPLLQAPLELPHALHVRKTPMVLQEAQA